MADKSKEFGDRLKKLRKMKGLTQKKLAENAGVQGNISLYEEGRIPEAPILYKLAKEFNISMEELLVGEPQKPSEIIDLNCHRDDKIYQNDPELKIKHDLFIKYWQTGNPYIRDLFNMGIKTAQALLEKDQPSNPKKKATPGKS